MLEFERWNEEPSPEFRIYDTQNWVATVYIGGRVEVAEALARKFCAVDKLIAACRKNLADCACQCGGIGEDGLATQPCEACDMSRAALAAVGVEATP